MPPDATPNRHHLPRLEVLAPTDGPVLWATQTLRITAALRSAAMLACPQQPPPPWLSGHGLGGEPARTPHVAFLALPLVGRPHADGHLQGLAMTRPAGVHDAEWWRCVGPLLSPPQGSGTREVRLYDGRRGAWSFRLEDRVPPPRPLDAPTWLGPATTWATATPVVLDRFTKADPAAQPERWAQEVTASLRASLSRAGLPEPAEARINNTAWHRGVPPAAGATRPGSTTSPGRQPYPPMPSHDRRPAKPRVHAWLRFDRPVLGPVLAGAGRFRGYGLFHPCRPASPTTS